MLLQNESVIWIKLSTLTRLLLHFLKVNFNNFSLGRWSCRQSLATSSLEDYSLSCYQQSHSRITSGFLFLKMFAATCESQTFVVILFNPNIFLILLRQFGRSVSFEKMSRNPNVSVRCCFTLMGLLYWRNVWFSLVSCLPVSCEHSFLLSS